MDARLGNAVAGALENTLSELLRLRLVQEIVIPNPAAGAEWSQIVPNVSGWELLAVHQTLLASAVVANRSPQVLVKDAGGNRVGRYYPNALVAAGAAIEQTYEAGLAGPAAASPSSYGLPVPPKIMLPGWSVGSLTGNLDVGDQYSQVVLTIREWTYEELVRQAEWLERHTPVGAR